MALSRWLAPAVLAAGLGLASFAPAPAQAQSIDAVTRAIVDIADVAFRGGQPYYRYGDYGSNDRLIVSRDRYGRPVYYRVVRSDRFDDRYRTGYTRSTPPYGYYGRAPGQVKCNSRGKCKAQYYDPRYDRHDRYGYDRRDDLRWRGRD
jgi:hypothetical protein